MPGKEVQVSDHDQLWTAVAQLLRAQVSEAVWFSTFQDVTALDSDPSMRCVIKAGGELLERFRLSRSRPADGETQARALENGMDFGR